MSDTRILDLRDYWQMIRMRLGIVAALAIVVAAIAGSYIAFRPATYFSQAKVIVDPLVNPAITGAVGNTSGIEPDMVIETEIVRSIDIARAVRESLGLTTTPEQLAKAVRVEPVRDAAVMYVGYSATRPETAAAIANSFAEEYLSSRREQILSSVESAITPLQDRVDELTQTAGELERDIQATDDPQEIGMMEASLEGVRAEITAISTDIAEIRGNGPGSGGSIVQFAVAPSMPSGPSIVLASVLGFVVGGIMGVGLAIAVGLRANRVGGRDELAGYLGAPVMAVIPTVDGWASPDRAELVSRDDPAGPAAEAYRTLATNLRFLRSQRAISVIVVTSALPGEGKSATAANLAVVLADSGVRTLLVDSDLRRPRAERFLGVRQGAGLREALDGSAALENVVLETAVDNLSIVRSGAMPHDPVALLAGPRANEVFHDVRRLGDIVICDAPPTLPVADASILAEVADAVVFVHDPSISSRTALQDAIRQLTTAGADIAGGVYNNVSSLQRASLGYATYDQYYGPGVGQGRRKQPTSTPKATRRPADQTSFAPPGANGRSERSGTAAPVPTKGSDS